MNPGTTSKVPDAGAMLSHYRVVSKIGSGGMGDVFLAEDTRLGRRVAIKILNEERSTDIEKLRRFILEAKAASALNHPNILTVYEIGETDGVHYIATELIDGDTLRQHLLVGDSLPLRTILRVTIQVADALSAAHKAGIIHRDIKPENIMIRSDGYTKLLDFGLAKLSETTQEEDSDASDIVKTIPGYVMGTILYMSPEQARGMPVDARTDLFSLGVVLYEMLTGQKPFSGETNSHAIVAILEKEPQPIAELAPHVPEDLARIASRLLAKKPDERYQFASDVATELKSLRRRLEFEAELERSMTPDKAAEVATQIFASAIAPPEADENTIAVLPFANLSGDESGDYFSDGLAEELLNVLSKIRGLRVAARTSAFSFKGKQTTIREIGHALNVSSVLEGSIRTAGDRVRIAVQLVKVADGYHIWSETYDRVIGDIFAVQDDIAGSVVEELRARLLGGEAGHDPSRQVVSEIADAVKGRADDPEALRLMLLGRYFADRTTPGDLNKAISYFKEALAIDPGFALGWAELGRAFSVRAGKAWVPFDEGYAESRDATKKALELEPQLAEAHAQLGRIQAAYDLDIAGAKASYAIALELAPGNSVVMDGVSVLEFKMGNFDEALRLSRQVLAQDPLSGSIWHNLGLICHAAGLLAESEKAMGRSLELAPGRSATTALLSLVLLDQGRQNEALDLANSEPDLFWRAWARSIITHALGEPAVADQAMSDVERIADESDAYQVAEIYSMRGEADKAFDWLARALAIRDPGLTHAKSSPRFRRLHGDPRWPGILKEIGFGA